MDHFYRIFFPNFLFLSLRWGRVCLLGGAGRGGFSADAGWDNLKGYDMSTGDKNMLSKLVGGSGDVFIVQVSLFFLCASWSCPANRVVSCFLRLFLLFCYCFWFP